MKIEYNMTISEIETAFMMFWRKYNLRQTILFSIVYGVAIYLSVDLIAKGSAAFGGIGMGLTAGLLISLWIRPVRAKKRLSRTLESAYEERYIATFEKDRIVIQTIAQVLPETKETQETQETKETQETQVSEKIDRSEYKLNTDILCSAETGEMFLLYVNRALIHAFPKRCLSETQIEYLRGYFVENKI